MQKGREEKRMGLAGVDTKGARASNTRGMKLNEA